jgi:hypothetical protein
MQRSQLLSSCFVKACKPITQSVQINRNTIGDVACSRPVEQWDTRQLVLGRSESINAALSRQLSRLDT